MAKDKPSAEEHSRVSPADILRALRDRWLVVVMSLLLGILCAALWSVVQPRTYLSEASAVVTAGVNENLGVALTADNLAKSKATQYQELAKSLSVARGAVERSGLDISPEAAAGSVAVAVPLDTAQVHLSVIQPSPEAAQALADAWVASLADEVSNVENQRLPGVAQPESEGQAQTSESIIRLLPLVEATRPTAPHSPNVPLALAIGAVVGLAMGLGATALLSLGDRRVKSAEVLERRFGLTVLGTIPTLQRKSESRRDRVPTRRGLRGKRAQTASANGRATLRETTDTLSDARVRESFHFRESFKELRTNLQFIRPDNPPRIIVVTSAVPAEGKSTVAANVAITLAESGVPTVLVDGDLRRPTVANSFHVEGSVGLTNVVVGEADVADVLQAVPDVGSLHVLASGPVPPNPSEILSSTSLERVLRGLAKDHVVIVDAPPLLPVTDAAILAAKYDGCLLVVTAGRTTLDEVNKAVGNLEKVSGQILGVALNRVPTKGTEAGYYGYYGKSYYSSTATSAE